MNSTRDPILSDIARRTLRVPTLDTRKSDSLDFHSISVWSLKAALEAAYEAGRASGEPHRIPCPACGCPLVIRLT